VQTAVVFQRIVNEVNLNADKKRFWLGEISSINSEILNESMPISMNYFTLVKIGICYPERSYFPALPIGP